MNVVGILGSASTLAANAEVCIEVGVGLIDWFLAILVRGITYKLVRVHLWPHTHGI